MLTRRIRRSPRVAQVAVTALVILALPGHGRASFGRSGHGKVVEGQLLVLHADDFSHGHSANSVALGTDTGDLVKVDISDVRDNEELVGKHVRLAGETHAGVFVAADGTTTSSSGTTQTAEGTAASTTTTAVHQTAVILLNFTNDQSQPWTPSQVADLMFGPSNSVNTYYQESSYGGVSFTGKIFGWVTIPYDNSGCNYWTWGSAAEDAVGVNPNNYNNVVYIWPPVPGCYWSGMGAVLGTMSWINGWVSVQTLAHELGHNIGVQHAGSLECYENGVRVTISATGDCSRAEYGDPYSVMGSGTRQWTNWNRGQIGWIPEMTTVTKSGSYTVAPVEASTQPRLVRVARGDGTYLYFEFRQPFGTYDNFSTSDPAVNGVLVRIAPDKLQLSQSALLDMTPQTYTKDDAALLVGKTFTDPVSGVSVTTTSVTPQGATIEISFSGGGSTGGDTTAPSAPTNLSATSTSSSVTLFWTSSTDNVGVSGYRVSRDGAEVGTTTGTTYTDTGLTPATAYQYAVVAYDAAGNTSAGAQTAVTTAADTSAPKTPSNLKALVIGTTQIALSWAASSDNVGVDAYDVYRDGVRVGSTALPNWLDEGLAPGSTHKYQVLARDAAGNQSALSSALSVRLLALATATTGTLAGVVYNELGRPQANVVVQVTGNGLAKSAKTGSSGTYKFSSLPPGDYAVTFARPATATTAASTSAAAAAVTAGTTFVLVNSP